MAQTDLAGIFQADHSDRSAGHYFSGGSNRSLVPAASVRLGVRGETGDGFPIPTSGSQGMSSLPDHQSMDWLWPRPLDPDFGSDKVQHKANPESDPEKLIRRQAGKAAGGEEQTDDGPNGGDSQSNRKGPDHPLPVLGDMAVQNMPIGFAQAEQKQQGKQRRRCHLIDAANGRYDQTHDQRR